MIVIKLGLMLAKVLAAIALLLLTAMPANLSAYDPEHDDPERSRKVADRNSFALWSILISCIAGSII